MFLLLLYLFAILMHWSVSCDIALNETLDSCLLFIRQCFVKFNLALRNSLSTNLDSESWWQFQGAPASLDALCLCPVVLDAIWKVCFILLGSSPD